MGNFGYNPNKWRLQPLLTTYNCFWAHVVGLDFQLESKSRISLDRRRFQWEIGGKQIQYLWGDESKSLPKIGDFTEGPWNGTLTSVLRINPHLSTFWHHFKGFLGTHFKSYLPGVPSQFTEKIVVGAPRPRDKQIIVCN